MKTNEPTTKQIKSFLIFTILLLASIVILLFNTNYSYAEDLIDSGILQNTENTENTTNDNLKIYSDAVILIENQTGKTLYEKNSEQKMYPASTTKILTAILSIEKGNLNDKVTVSKTAIAQMKPGYTSAYLSEGEIISVEDLLKVLLINSANDASNVLAEYISGSIDSFVTLMNEKSKELGCTNTHFVTTNGLHDDNHYTTAKDLAIIARYCMQNETFRKIVSMKKCVIPATNKSEERIYKNTNDLINPTSGYYYPSCIGIKTGFTSEAKNCLISACSKNGLQVIAVVLGASITENHKSARYVDSKTLYDYTYSNYSIQNIAKASSVIETIEVKNATDETKSLDLKLEKDLNVLVNNKDKENIKTEIVLKDNISAPIATNSVVGNITYIVGADKYTINLLASHDVEKKENIIWILRLSLFLILLILIIFIIYKISKKPKK